MNWETLNIQQFTQAVKDSKGVCLVPIGCIEKHGDHLPLGTDLFFGRDVCLRAAAMETAVVFPSYPFGQVSEVRHYMGAVALEANLQMELMQALCDEIARNGLDKIILVCSHGGNTHMLRYFAQSQLDKRRDYTVYAHIPNFSHEMTIHLNAKYGAPQGEGGGHADINETGFIMSISESLVAMENLQVEQTQPQGNLKHLHNAYTGLHFYGDYPHHVAGDPTGATAERGAAWRDFFVNDLVATIQSIKLNDNAANLQHEFFDMADKPGA
ncbi:MAG: creatininase family protein [Oscillospiraceae bacterium]|nr:creatininase family protein [Oscillospiraceae bacterium]